MALPKQSVPVNFSQGLDTKTDPNQVQVGKFLTLTNSVFTKGGALTKRNGFAQITTLPNDLETTLTTFNGNLIATGSDLYFYNAENNSWTDSGTIQPIGLKTLPVTRTSTSQSNEDAAVSPSGLACIAYIDNNSVYYQVSDSVTGQQLVTRQLLAVAGACPRVYVLVNYFVITFLATVGGGTHLRYIAIPLGNPTSPTAIADISSSLTGLTVGYDATVAGGNLYIAWADTGSSVKLAYISSTLITTASVVIPGSFTPTLMSVSADLTTPSPTIWVFFSNSSGSVVRVTAYTSQLAQIIAPFAPPIALSGFTGLRAITSAAQNSNLYLFYDYITTYLSPYPVSNIATDFVGTAAVNISGSTVEAATTILRSVGLASKAFIDSTNGKIYMLAVYGDTDQADPTTDSNQPTYFLIDSTGNIYMRLAYSNGGGYATSQSLPNVTYMNANYYVAYLFRDFLAAVNKGTNNPTGTPSNAIYTQTGINLAKFNINTSGQFSEEIAGALHLTGGQLWEYDGIKPVEHGFQVWPENVQVTTSTAGATQTFYYQFTYEWTDGAGNLHRSAPSIPVTIQTAAGTPSNTLYVPTLRLTYKTAPNPVRIVGYRWSVAQQVYYQFTSITSPVINDLTVDYVTITDNNTDAQILGNTLLYTAGGVIENIAAPASTASALFKNRLFLVDAEDQNLLWYSKQVIEAVPVEMSDLLTLYVAPTTGAQGSTGPVTALSAMDDKLIIFKQDAIYYLTGQGPDNTGASNDFTDPIYITSSVGCANPNSIVLMPQGLMFQSDKGIWLLGRDLSTNYVGAPVEAYNSQTVESAQAIPGTNQVRFLLGNNITLMYDYYYNQWGTFTNIRAVSATLYQGYHTYLNSYGQVFQETPNTYLDGSQPVLMSLTTSWMNVAGIRGFERFYYFLMLGTYYTPFKLNVQLAYDYGLPEYSILVTPDNQTPNWGGDALWGSGAYWGGPGNAFQARIFPQKQKCQTFQVTMNEVYDPSFGQPAGQGLSLSGFNFVIGVKKGYSPQRASRSFG